MTSPHGVICVLSVKWTNSRPRIRVSPRLFCLMIVFSHTFGFLSADLWLPYCRYALKFAYGASALHYAGAPVVSVKWSPVKATTVPLFSGLPSTVSTV